MISPESAVAAISWLSIFTLATATLSTRQLWMKLLSAVYLIQMTEGCLTNPLDHVWLTIWAHGEAALLAVSVATVIHLVIRQTMAMDHPTRYWVRCGVGCWHLAIYYWLWAPVKTPMAVFIEVRSLINIWIALTLVALVAICIITGNNRGPSWRYAASYMLLAVASAFIGASYWDGLTWRYYNVAWRAALSLVATYWCLFCPGPVRGSGAQPAEYEAPPERT